MRRTWLIFSQAVTVAVALLFVVATLKPEWLGRSPGRMLPQIVSIESAPAGSVASAPAGVAAAAGFRSAAQRAAPAVVSIVASKISPRRPQAEDPWFRFFFGDRNPQNQPQRGLGSGVIVSPEGYLITNNHVVEGADDIEVILADGRQAQAKLVGTDPDSDVAVLKIGLDKLPAIAFGDLGALQVGDAVLAIGNPFGVGQTVTAGIVSALGRNRLGINTFENFIQTDAAINPGNSGGALVDTQGRLLGINTAIYSRSGGSMGIGFAIPVSTGKQVLESIVKDGQVTRGWIGVEPQDLSPEVAEAFGIKPEAAKAGGVILTGVLQNGPAAQAGILPGDVITDVAGKPVRTVTELLSAVAGLKPGVSAPLGVLRKDKKTEIAVVPGTRQRPKIQR